MRQLMSKLRPGDHAALFYRSRAEQFAAAVPYIQIGLERNERCLYIAGDNSVRTVINAMESGGIDVERAQSEGRLTITTPDRTYLRHGVFEPEKVIEGLNQEVESSLREGYSAFRGTGELGWATTLPSVLVRLYEYERLFDANLAPSFLALCQYNETTFRPDIICQMLRIHPKVIARGQLRENGYYVGPESALEDHPSVTVEQLFCAA